ncbi:MAG: hypothetical protein AABY07_01845 [Nanoarchaeota archaeon]
MKLADKISKEHKGIFIFALVSFVVILLIFYKEKNIFLILKLFFVLIYLFMLPGYLLLNLLLKNMRLEEKLALAYPLGLAIIGTISYILLILNLNLNTILLLPAAVIIVTCIKLFKA